MRRMNDKDIIKSNIFIIICAVVFVLVGVLLPLVPVLIPTAEYSELIDKEIVIQSVERIHPYKGTTYHRITTADGEQYNITGDYTNTDVDKYLYEGQIAAIKYYENQLLFKTKKYAEVITVDGISIVHYDNDKDNGIWVLHLLSVCCILIAIGAVWFVVWQIKSNRKKRAKRDRKIIKKYGSVRK
ncbi:MAG: hypothetical protein E7448_02340 [Ruminococcaceae bacterium]|nr:hypothetical protein [Oscillospiraceae bacterium]